MPRSPSEYIKIMKNTIRASAKKKPIIVAVSGGFDPVHVGHTRMFREAKKLGDVLVVILNNDHWLRKKKNFIFMPDYERKEVIKAFHGVDHVVVTGHRMGTEDMSVCRELKKIRPHIFANGGDRKPDGDPVPEVELCKKLGIKMVYNIGSGGKVQSSSWLLADYVKRATGRNLEKKKTQKKGR